MDNKMALFALTVIIISTISVINTRRLISFSLFSLIVLTPISQVYFMPRGVMGIRGLTLYNIVWLVAAFLILSKYLLHGRNLRLGEYFSGPVVVFGLLFLYAVLWTVYDFDSLPKFGQNSQTSITVYLLENLFKPLQLFLTGWLVLLYMNMTGNKELIQKAILTAATIAGVMVTLFYITGMSADYVTGRNMVSTAFGLHANSVGAMSVYFFLACLLFSEKSLSRYRYPAIVMSSVAIILSFSRIAYIAFLVMIFFYFRRLRAKEKIALIIILGAIFMASLPLISARVQYGFSSGSGEIDINRLSATRVERIWAPAIKQAIKHPFAGNGTDSWLKQDLFTNKYYVGNPHSAYLIILLDMGVLGLFSLFFLLKYFYRIGKNSVIGFHYYVLAFIVLTLTGHSFYPYLANYLVWIVYGLSLHSAKPPTPGRNRFRIKRPDNPIYVQGQG